MSMAETLLAARNKSRKDSALQPCKSESFSTRDSSRQTHTRAPHTPIPGASSTAYTPEPNTDGCNDLTVLLEVASG